MRWIRSLFTAFAMYSRLPVPCAEWKKEDMQYAIGFFPFVGILVGGAEYLWFCAARYMNQAFLSGRDGEELLSAAFFLFQVLIACILPVLLTGGIHVDGFMDTSDALNSWGDQKQKLQILKDSHIGAFSVISLLKLAALWIAAAAVISGRNNARITGIFALEFVLSRALSGLAAVWFQNARGEGSLYTFTDLPGSARCINTGLLMGAGFLAAFGMILLYPVQGLVTAAVSIAVFGLYKRKACREFGGITGDLEGWFLCRCEAAAALVLAAASLFLP